jgi:hypothetical protein
VGRCRADFERLRAEMIPQCRTPGAAREHDCGRNRHVTRMSAEADRCRRGAHHFGCFSRDSKSGYYGDMTRTVVRGVPAMRRGICGRLYLRGKGTL